MKKARGSLISFRRSNGEPIGARPTHSWVPHSIAFLRLSGVGRRPALSVSQGSSVTDSILLLQSPTQVPSHLLLIARTPRLASKERTQTWGTGLPRLERAWRFSGGAAFDHVDSTSLTSPSWIRQGATHRTRNVAESGSPGPDMHFRVSLKVTPKCKNPYVVGHAR